MNGMKPILFYFKNLKDIHMVIPINAINSGDDEKSDVEDVFQRNAIPEKGVEESWECSEDKNEVSIQCEYGGSNAIKTI